MPVIDYRQADPLGGASRWLRGGASLPPPTPPDVTEPAVTDLDPPEGARMPTRRTPIGLTVSDETALAIVTVSVAYPSGAEEVAHDGSVFVPPYLASTRVPLGPASWRYTLRRAPEWPDDPTVRVYAVDSSGNVGGGAP